MEKNNENKGEIYEVELERGRYYKVPWGNMKVGTPYVAKIEGLDPKYGFKRKFLKPVFVDRNKEEYLIDANDLEPGAIYEIKNPSSWKHPDTRTYFIVRKIEAGKMVIEYLEKKELIIGFKEMEEIKANNEK